jgi:signal transduction histidine kinase
LRFIANEQYYVGINNYETITMDSVGTREEYPIRQMTRTLAVLIALFLLIRLSLPLHLMDGVYLMPLWVHSFLEMFSIAVAMLVFGVVWNAYSSDRSGNMVILGCAFLAVGLIDCVHLLSYRGMPDFITPASPRKAINFWLAARFIAALTLLAVGLRPWQPLAGRHTRHALLAGSLALTALIYWLGLYQPQLWPETFIEGKGLTEFKIAAEYAIIAILALAALTFYANGKQRPTYDAASFFCVAVISALSEFCFTAYRDVADVFNLLGHVFKIAAYLFLYRAAFVASVQEPFRKMYIEVAERKSAEEALRLLNQSLEQRVAQRTRQLEQANKELEAFSYSVSHDLRAPLRAIDGFSQALEKSLDAQIGEKDRDYLGRVHRASRRMGQLIDDMLHLSHISRKEVRKAPVDVTALARDIADDLRQRDPARQVEFAIEEGMRIEADAKLIRIVLENLLANAWKFTSRKAQAKIDVGTGPQDDGKTIFVRDNGAGFDMEYAHKLFSPFQRLHDASEFEGSGIGLATVQRIIDRHGGRVWAEGKEGSGAIFYFSCGQQNEEATHA